jgi:hypothetical protein
MTEGSIDVHAQSSAHDRLTLTRANSSFLNAGKQRRDGFVEPTPFVGQRNRPGGAIEDADADTLFQALATARLTAGWVSPIASPARAKLPASTTATTTPIPLNNRLSKLMTHTFCHHSDDEYALFLSAGNR